MKNQKTLAEKFLWLGVVALAVAGVFAVLLVAARTPQLKQFTIMQGIFDVALVVHVDLSVLVWFFCVLGMGVAQVTQPYAGRWPYWLQAAFITLALATLLMALSPLDAPWQVIKSNYIPVLHNPPFLLSLGLLSAGLLLLAVPPVLICASWARLRTITLVDMGFSAAALCVLLALIGFFLSAQQLPVGLTLERHYEILFWAGGHIFQFVFTLLMMAAWLALLAALGLDLPPRRLVLVAYGLAVIGALASLAGFVIHPFNSSEFTYYFTRMMIELGGIGAALLAFMVSVKLVGIFNSAVWNEVRAYASSLLMSLMLFVAGGALGLMISGQNVGIPAHYHGQIVSITLALMGLAYTMLPRFGYVSVASSRLAFWQPVIYGAGQIIHIGGLAYSGGYGILRKTAGGFEHLEPSVKAALGVMGLGGLIAVIGGIMFVVVMLRAYFASASCAMIGTEIHCEDHGTRIS